jgi:precorrin-6A/cobalt-precorrin-6A reductase
MSLAGRTTFPAAFPIPVRTGGFGGAEGLASFLRENGFDLIINATHPYATQMWRNAIDAARLADVPLVAFHRPPWTPTTADKWTQVDGVARAITVLGRRKARNVFLPLGHKELIKFEAVPRHRYLIRAIETFDPPLNLPKASYLKARPPFDKASEIELLKKHSIDVMIVKNSGGSASYAKIVAARELGIEVIVIAGLSCLKSTTPGMSRIRCGRSFMPWTFARSVSHRPAPVSRRAQPCGSLAIR